jgi:hypothetical protein
MTRAALENDVRLHIYHHFVNHQGAPTATEIAGSLDTSLQDVKAAMEALAEARVLVLKPASREVWMAMPFSAAPTSFRVLSGSKVWWAN